MSSSPLDHAIAVEGEEDLVAIGAAFPVALRHAANLLISGFRQHRQRSRIVGNHGRDQEPQAEDLECVAVTDRDGVSSESLYSTNQCAL